MIVADQINERLIKHYSDAGLYILQNETGIEYSEAVDVIPCRYTYTETNKAIEKEENYIFGGGKNQKLS